MRTETHLEHVGDLAAREGLEDVIRHVDVARRLAVHLAPGLHNLRVAGVTGGLNNNTHTGSERG